VCVWVSERDKEIDRERVCVCVCACMGVYASNASKKNLNPFPCSKIFNLKIQEILTFSLRVFACGMHTGRRENADGSFVRHSFGCVCVLVNFIILDSA